MRTRNALLLAVLCAAAAASFTPLDAAPVSAPDGRSARSHKRTQRQQVDDQVETAISDARERADRILSRYGDVIFGLMIPLGLLFAVAGYRLLKPTVFLAGFFIGGFLTSALVYELTKDKSAGAWAPVLSFIIGGAIVGLIAVFFINFGFFVAGAALGVTLSFILRSLFASISNSNSEWAFYIFVGVMALAFGILAVCLKKPVVIVATSFGGSFSFVYGIARFSGDFLTPNEFFADDREEVGWESWAIFGGWLILGFLGVVIQYKFTANKNKKKKDTESYNATLRKGVQQDAQV